MKFKGFHIDMNNAQFTGEYLKKWLKRLTELGYDTIIWEVENNIAWETCPQCVSPDAFTKDEFREILQLCESLGLRSIPLLQTLGHCEYVLKNPEYSHLAELPDRVDQYCPMNEKVVPFLNKWVDEYLELFGTVEFFHLGADEAWTLGECEKCKQYAEENSHAELYLQHMNKIIQPLLSRGIRPVIWADMALRHPDMLDNLSREVVLCDWMYEIYKGCGGVWNWTASKMQSPSELDETFMQRFGKYIFPEGQVAGCEPNIFYSSDYLADSGFDVIGCPSSSIYGDSVFAPQLLLHLKNCFDFLDKGNEEKMAGWILTSWTCHLFPWILQEACIDLPAAKNINPEITQADYKRKFVEDSFGSKDSELFWDGVEAFAQTGLFMLTHKLGCGKNPQKVPKTLVLKKLDEIEADGQLESEIEKAVGLVGCYQDGLNKLKDFSATINKGKDSIYWWLLAACNQLNRARVSLYLLESRVKSVDADIGQRLLDEMLKLKRKTDSYYSSQIKPTRRADMMHWIYDSCEYSLRLAIVSVPQDKLEFNTV